jgi:hypothetical protein
LGPEEGVVADKKSLYILHSVVERATAEMKDNKATGDDDVPGDLVKLFREDSLSTVTQQINNIYKTGEWPKNFTEVTVIVLKKKPKATKCSESHTVSCFTNTANRAREYLD